MATSVPVEVTHYTFRVTWSVEDGEFVATVAEFPSMSWLAPTQGEALEGLADLVTQTVIEMAAAGDEVPQPLVDRVYSGKFNVRVGEGLHRALATRAAEERMSLNQYVVRKLSSQL